MRLVKTFLVLSSFLALCVFITNPQSSHAGGDEADGFLYCMRECWCATTPEAFCAKSCGPMPKEATRLCPKDISDLEN